jgi:hypothetical protein
MLSSLAFVILATKRAAQRYGNDTTRLVCITSNDSRPLTLDADGPVGPMRRWQYDSALDVDSSVAYPRMPVSDNGVAACLLPKKHTMLRVFESDLRR